MGRYRCSECLEEAGTEIDRAVTDAGLKRQFECGGCEHVWDVIF